MINGEQNWNRCGVFADSNKTPPHHKNASRCQRANCWGRTGDQHTEWFPGVGHGISHGDSLHDAKRKLALVYIGMATDKFSDVDTEIFALLSKERALKDEIERAQKNN